MKWDLGTAIYALRRNIKLSSLKYVGVPNTTVMVSEAYAFHEPSLKSRPKISRRSSGPGSAEE